jgi:hypothetical protein
MDLRYLMLKNRYKFVYSTRLTVFSTEESLQRKNEITLLLTELSLYKVDLRSLSSQKPSASIKDELLNIAYACTENKLIFDSIRKKRELPVKKLAAFTYKSPSFIQRWHKYILAYTVLLSNTIYKQLKNYLSIEIRDTSQFEEDNASRSIAAVSESSSEPGQIIGLTLKPMGSTTYILTPYGDFIKVRPDERSSLDIGSLCSGKITRDFTFYKYPLALGMILLFSSAVVSLFMYFHISRTVLIDANSSIKLQVNDWNRIVKVTPLSPNGNAMASSLKLFNKSLDEGIYSILSYATDTEIIKPDTRVNIFFSGLKKTEPALTETEAFIIDNNLKVQINNNGSEYRVNKPSRDK